jgi:hypothetical protein
LSTVLCFSTVWYTVDIESAVYETWLGILSLKYHWLCLQHFECSLYSVVEQYNLILSHCFTLL